MPSFITKTIGCKVNQYETQVVATALRRSGLTDVGSRSKAPCRPCADLVVVNTCCVTASAAAKSRHAILRAIRENPRADIIVLGCYATAEAKYLQQLILQAGSTGEVIIIGHHDDLASRLRGYLDNFLSRSQPSHAPRPDDTIRFPRYDECMRANPYRFQPKEHRSHNFIKPLQHLPVKNNTNRSITGIAALPPLETFSGHQRAFVKVQDGCDAFCTYCIIPRLRGKPRSRPIDEILQEVRQLVANGHKEIVLCGVFLGAYGQETTVRSKWTEPSALPELLRTVAETPGLWRVRLSSLEPGDLTEELLKVFRDYPNVAAHLHLPLQSGSDSILKRMNRQYDSRQFLQAVERAREALDNPAITTDIVVGFPGQTDEDFAATVEVARKVGFSKMHIFPFSPREGTAAWNLRDQMPPREVIKARCVELAHLGRELAENFRKQFIGQNIEALVELPNSKTPPNHARGLTERYIEVAFPTDKPEELTGQVVRVKITGLSQTGLVGIIDALPPRAHHEAC